MGIDIFHLIISKLYQELRKKKFLLIKLIEQAKSLKKLIKD